MPTLRFGSAMPGEIDDQRGEAYYTEFYRNGGWKYSYWREYWWHRRQVVKRFGLRRGMEMLEVACGCGFHTDLFNRMGFDCTGIDRSEAGIAWAKSHYPKRNYLCGDIRNAPFAPESFDVVIARGCSHYHYDLLDDIPMNTSRTLLQMLRPGGVFIMAIVTDLSGRKDPDRVWNNTLDDYRRHFSSFGTRWSVDWVKGMAVCGLFNERVEASEGNEGRADKPPVSQWAAMRPTPGSTAA